MKTRLSLTILKIIGFILLVLFIKVCTSTSENLTALLSSAVIPLITLVDGRILRAVYHDEYNDVYKEIADAGTARKSDMLPADLIGLIEDEELDRIERHLIKNPHMQVSQIY